jgi:hypothetical protein
LTTPSRPSSRLGDSLEVFVRREDADRFIGEVRGNEPELAAGGLGQFDPPASITAQITVRIVT